MPREDTPSNRAHLILSESEFLSDKYKMDYPKRGTAVIINNSSFSNATRMGIRSGSQNDEKYMYHLLNRLGFEEIIKKANRTCAQMQADLKEVASKDHSSDSCFVCVILSYGEEGYVFGTDNKISVDDLFDPFKGNNCVTLTGKPKMFIIQACSAKYTQDREESDAAKEMEEELEEEISFTKIPTEADFLTVYSEVPGHFGWESDNKKSWFIQSICDVFNTEWTEKDVLTIMTRVLRRMEQHLESSIARSKHFQIPCVTSMLTKSWYFKNFVN